MFQVRFHGRGGQGVVTAAELLASAAFGEDRHAQAFLSFGSGRMGAPVMSYRGLPLRASSHGCCSQLISNSLPSGSFIPTA